MRRWQNKANHVKTQFWKKVDFGHFFDCSVLVEGVDLSSRIMCQIFGQDNLSYKIQKL